MPFLTIILIIGLFVHIGLGIYAAKQVIKTCELNANQKRINILLIFIVPIIWSVLIYYMFKKLPESYEIDPKDKFVPNDFMKAKKAFTEEAEVLINHHMPFA